MSVTVPAIRATMGSRDYFISKMTASEISGQVSIASELSDWRELTLNELYQRKLNEKRVEQDIAPYLANTSDRFFGSIIIWILDPEAAVFEPAADFVTIPRAYESAARSIGFLVLDSSQASGQAGFVALDGQHRLAALRRVVRNETDGAYSGDVYTDEVAVIFVSDHDVRSARDLFTVLNRSARRVTKSDVLIMSEVDGAAIVARDLTGSSLLAPYGLGDGGLVKWEKNTIAQRDEQITTLNAIYEVVQIVADFLKIDLQAGEEAGNPPPEADLAAVRVETERWLSALFKESPAFASMRLEPLKIPEMRKESQYSLMLKPVGFQAFFGAVAVALNKSAGNMTDLHEAVRRLLAVDWSISSNFWRGIMVNAKGNVTNKKTEIQLASDLAAWMITGKSSSTTFQQSLTERYRRQLGRADAALPTPLEFS